MSDSNAPSSPFVMVPREQLQEWWDRFCGYKSDGTNWNYSDLVAAMDQMRVLLEAAPAQPVDEAALREIFAKKLACVALHQAIDDVHAENEKYAELLFDAFATLKDISNMSRLHARDAISKSTGAK